MVVTFAVIFATSFMIKLSLVMDIKDIFIMIGSISLLIQLLLMFFLKDLKKSENIKDKNLEITDKLKLTLG